MKFPYFDISEILVIFSKTQYRGTVSSKTDWTVVSLFSLMSESNQLRNAQYPSLRQNGGRCGYCGDPHDLPPPRPHESGGVFGRGTIVREYFQGQTVVIIIQLVRDRRGFFEVDICSDGEDCDSPMKLVLASSGGERFHLPRKPKGSDTGERFFKLDFVLPEVQYSTAV